MTPIAPAGAGSRSWSRRPFLAVLAAIGLVRPAFANSATVKISRFAFSPSEVEIGAGGTVTFVNLDLVPHTATGDAFDTGPLHTDERMEIAFPIAGEFQYLCRYHRQMRGRIIVR